MIGKIAGGAFIVVATTKIGCNEANKLSRRKKQLKAIQSGIWLLKSDINFTLSTLSTALKRASNLVDKSVCELFLITSKYIDDGMTAYDAFTKAFNVLRSNLDLKESDYNVLYDFAKNLGCGDIDSEIKNFDKTLELLKISETNADENILKYSKLTKTLGVTLGILIIILIV